MLITRCGYCAATDDNGVLGAALGEKPPGWTGSADSASESYRSAPPNRAALSDGIETFYLNSSHVISILDSKLSIKNNRNN